MLRVDGAFCFRQVWLILSYAKRTEKARGPHEVYEIIPRDGKALGDRHHDG